MKQNRSIRIFRPLSVTGASVLLVASLICDQGHGQQSLSRTNEAAELQPDALEPAAGSTKTSKSSSTPDRYVVVLSLGEQEKQTLRRDGRLRATLPPKFRDRVDAVTLKHPTTFLSERLTIQDDTEKLGRTLLVYVDESIVDRLEYQPVQMKVYQSGFDAILLKYQGLEDRSKLSSIHKQAKPQPNDSPRVFVRLSAQNGTTGWVRDMKSLKVKTDYGTIDMPLSRIAGIRFNTDEADEVLIFSSTGDSVTGKITQSEIVLATRWGDETIPVSKLESITYSRDVKFLEVAAGSDRRWKLTQPAQPATSLPFTQPFPGIPTNPGLPNIRF